MLTIRSRALLSITAMLISGCARFRTAPAIDDRQPHQEQKARLEHWQVSGKLGIRMPGENNSANLRWQQQQQEFRIDLAGPFGQGRIIISGDEQLVTLEQAGQPPQYSSTSEQLIRDAIGWHLPLSDLRYWVRGIPNPDKPVTRRKANEQGLLEQLEQSGWQLAYSNYMSADGWPLPGRIVASHQDVRVTLVIRQWDIASASETYH
jgi:outer membrane lipoprotein LolB